MRYFFFLFCSKCIRVKMKYKYNEVNKGGDMADILVVTSKVKKVIKETGDCNTSGETIQILSKAVEALCRRGIESAKNDGRKTVMARDIPIDHI